MTRLAPTKASRTCHRWAARGASGRPTGPRPTRCRPRPQQVGRPCATRSQSAAAFGRLDRRARSPGPTARPWPRPRRRPQATARAHAGDRAETVHLGLRASWPRSPGRPRKRTSATSDGREPGRELGALARARCAARGACPRMGQASSGRRSRRAACGRRACARAARARVATAPSTTSLCPASALVTECDEVRADRRGHGRAGSRRCCRPHERSRAVPRDHERGQIGDLEHQVGRRLDPQQVGPRGEGLGDLRGVVDVDEHDPPRALADLVRGEDATW